MLSARPYDIYSTENPPLIRSRNLKYMSGARRPDSAASESSFVQYSDALLADFESMSRSPSSSIDPVFLSDADDPHASASIRARRDRTNEIEKIYPSHFRATNRYDSGDNWVEQAVTADPSRDPSEELPAYPRSAKSLKSTTTSREADRGDDDDDHFVLPSSYPALPELHLSLSCE